MLVKNDDEVNLCKKNLLIISDGMLLERKCKDTKIKFRMLCINIAEFLYISVIYSEQTSFVNFTSPR